jgi:hypothetical protein
MTNMTVSKATLGIAISEALSGKPRIQDAVGSSIILLLLLVMWLLNYSTCSTQ